jgi:competence protein ComGE
MLLKNKNKGYYLLELLLSLSGWILIGSIMVPMLVVFNKQSNQIQEKSEALQILYEYVQEVLIENPDRENFSVIKNNKSYDIIWVGEKEERKSEVCIRYEDVNGNIIQINETVQ